MRKLFRTLPIIALLAAPLQVFGGTTATMQVSFTVLASCTVDDHGATAPAVHCAQVGGYIVAPQAAPMNVAGSDATGWTVYF
jgi:hypothetical protein